MKPRVYPRFERVSLVVTFLFNLWGASVAALLMFVSVAAVPLSFYVFSKTWSTSFRVFSKIFSLVS